MRMSGTASHAAGATRRHGPGMGEEGAALAMARPTKMPAGSWPLPKRGLSRVEAAHYIGVGTSKFDEMVKDGRMPHPVRIDGRVIWDRCKLDLAFEDLTVDGAVNPWDETLASTSGD